MKKAVFLLVLCFGICFCAFSFEYSNIVASGIQDDNSFRLVLIENDNLDDMVYITIHPKGKEAKDGSKGAILFASRGNYYTIPKTQTVYIDNNGRIEAVVRLINVAKGIHYDFVYYEQNGLATFNFDKDDNEKEFIKELIESLLKDKNAIIDIYTMRTIDNKGSLAWDLYDEMIIKVNCNTTNVLNEFNSFMTLLY